MLSARWHRVVIVWVLAVLGLAAGSAVLGRDLYVAPNGSPRGDGSQNKPLDLNTVLSEKSPAKPGDTVYLKGGRDD